MMASVDVNDGTVTIIEPPKIVLGGISGNFFHATETENYLVSYGKIWQKVLHLAKKVFFQFLKDMNSQETLDGALATMDTDVANAFPDSDPPSYNLHLAKALLYKVWN